jgi:hypothetical protein
LPRLLGGAAYGPREAIAGEDARALARELLDTTREGVDRTQGLAEELRGDRGAGLGPPHATTDRGSSTS